MIIGHEILKLTAMSRVQVSNMRCEHCQGTGQELMPVMSKRNLQLLRDYIAACPAETLQPSTEEEVAKVCAALLSLSVYQTSSHAWLHLTCPSSGGML